MKKIKSSYILKEEILDYLPIQRTLEIFCQSKEYLNILQFTPALCKLFSNINDYFESYKDYIDVDMLSYINYFSRLNENIPLDSIKYFFFRFLREQNRILINYSNIYFDEFISFLSKGNYKGTLVIQINEDKYDLTKCPNIDIKSSMINIELIININVMEKEYMDNLEFVKTLLSDKIIGITNKNLVKKIKFIEPIDINIEKSRDFYEFILMHFPNSLVNIQCLFLNDTGYWQSIEGYYHIKILLEDKSLTGNHALNFKLNQINSNLSSINNLEELTIDYYKNKLNLTDKYFAQFATKNNTIKPDKLTLINFGYDRYRYYFEELNNHIKALSLIQHNYKDTPYPFKMYEKMCSLLVLKLEKINIHECNLVNVIRNNKSLEVFEFNKKHSKYVYGKQLSTALSELKNLKVLTTHFFWYKDNLNSYELFKNGHVLENEFYKYLKSDSLRFLKLSLESNINIQTLNANLPNLFKLTIETSNIVTYSNDNLDQNENEKNEIKRNKDNKYSRYGKYSKNNLEENEEDEKANKDKREKKYSKYSKYNKEENEKKEEIKTSSINIIHQEENNSPEEGLFKKLNELILFRVINCDSFCKKIVNFNKIGKLSLVTHGKSLFEGFNKYCYYLTNLEHLAITPDFTEKIDEKEFELLVKNIHCFKKLTSLEIGFFNMSQSLIDLLYNEVKSLPNLEKLKIINDRMPSSTRMILENKFNELKISKGLSIMYAYKNKKLIIKLLIDKLRNAH